MPRHIATRRRIALFDEPKYRSDHGGALKITPSSRRLKGLGEPEELPFATELTIKAVDDFAEITKSGIRLERGFKVGVRPISRGTKLYKGEIVDQGAGHRMTQEEFAAQAGRPKHERFDLIGPFAIVIQNTKPEIYHQLLVALRANNGLFGRLGLFGMGFNIYAAHQRRRIKTLATLALLSTNSSTEEH